MVVCRSCVNDALDPPLPAWFLALSGAPEAFLAEQGRAWGATQCLRNWAEGGFGARHWGRKNVFRAQKTFEERD
jgi:hypothetical protein